MYDDIRELVEYSPDGKSFAFNAEKNRKVILVKDGKEIDKYDDV